MEPREIDVPSRWAHPAVFFNAAAAAVSAFVLAVSVLLGLRSFWLIALLAACAAVGLGGTALSAVLRR